MIVEELKGRVGLALWVGEKMSEGEGEREVDYLRIGDK